MVNYKLLCASQKFVDSISIGWKIGLTILFFEIRVEPNWMEKMPLYSGLDKGLRIKVENKNGLFCIEIKATQKKHKGKLKNQVFLSLSYIISN